MSVISLHWQNFKESFEICLRVMQPWIYFHIYFLSLTSLSCDYNIGSLHKKIFENFSVVTVKFITQILNGKQGKGHDYFTISVIFFFIKYHTLHCIILMVPFSLEIKKNTQFKKIINCWKRAVKFSNMLFSSGIK